MIKIKLNNFSCYGLCDVGASTSVMPKRMYDMLELKPFDSCSFGVRLVYSSVNKPLGKIDDVLIIVNDNYVSVDFIIMDIECEPSCPIILGRPFLRTVGAVIDMKEGIIKLQFPLKKGMEHLPRKRLSCLLSPSHGLVIFLKRLDLFALSLANGFKEALSGGSPQRIYDFLFFLLFLVVLMIFNTVATSLYLYFSSFVPFITSYDKGSESCDMLSRKQILSSCLEKSQKIPVHLFEMNFL